MGFLSSFAYLLILCTFVQSKNSTQPRDYLEQCENAQTLNLGDQYVLHNNIWGWQSDGAGMQCVWSDTGNGQWGVYSSHTDGSAQDIKGYPSIVAGWIWFDDAGSIWARPEDKTYPTQITNIISFSTTWDVTVPFNGEKYDTAYDLWLDPNPNPNYKAQYEIMVWINYQGPAYNGPDFSPIGSQVGSNVNIAGHAWDIYTGWNGENNVYSFRRTQNTNVVENLNLLELINYAVNAGFIQNSYYLLGIQAGWEVVSGGAWTTNRWSSSIQKYSN